MLPFNKFKPFSFATCFLLACYFSPSNLILAACTPVVQDLDKILDSDKSPEKSKDDSKELLESIDKWLPSQFERIRPQRNSSYKFQEAIQVYKWMSKEVSKEYSSVEKIKANTKLYFDEIRKRLDEDFSLNDEEKKREHRILNEREEAAVQESLKIASRKIAEVESNWLKVIETQIEFMVLSFPKATQGKLWADLGLTDENQKSESSRKQARSTERMSKANPSQLVFHLAYLETQFLIEEIRAKGVSGQKRLLKLVSFSKSLKTEMAKTNKSKKNIFAKPDEQKIEKQILAGEERMKHLEQAEQLAEHMFGSLNRMKELESFQKKLTMKHGDLKLEISTLRERMKKTRDPDEQKHLNNKVTDLEDSIGYVTKNLDSLAEDHQQVSQLLRQDKVDLIEVQERIANLNIKFYSDWFTGDCRNRSQAIITMLKTIDQNELAKSFPK